MSAATNRNFHVPLSAETYRALREEADRQQRAATALAREAVEDWLGRLRAEALHADIAAYAARQAGTAADLDPALEAVGVENLLGVDATATQRRSKRPRRRRQ